MIRQMSCSLYPLDARNGVLDSKKMKFFEGRQDDELLGTTNPSGSSFLYIRQISLKRDGSRLSVN